MWPFDGQMVKYFTSVRADRNEVIPEERRPVRPMGVHYVESLREHNDIAEPQEYCTNCGEALSNSTVHGVELFGILHENIVTFERCRSCVQSYLQIHSTFCRLCERAIFPGTDVRFAYVDYFYPYAHAWCNPLLPFVGEWGEGRLIPLGEEPYDRMFTRCGVCLKKIPPKTLVGYAPPDSLYPLAHFSAKCCPQGKCIGTWGRGRLISLDMSDTVKT